MRNSARFTVSLPWREYQEMEATRKTARVSRSAFLLQALRSWKEASRMERLKAAYEEGYRRIPEDPALAESLAKAAAHALTDEDWE
jgi:metal-responsive CopG/Arc/MetJ family transcriptional regulator